jgi:hypothetical protein
MDQFFYEVRSKEKIKGLMEEGMRSQAHYRSQPNVSHRLPRLIVMLMGILGLLGFLSR